jgi:TRAP-type C4-dicarboxylate transport system substrate-binding protein
MIHFARWTILLLAAAAAGCAPAAAQTLMRFNSWLPPTHPIMSQTIRPWAEEVARITQNRVRIEFTAQSLGPPPNQFNMVKDGVADAAITVHGYTPARFPLMQIGELPFLSDLSEPLSVGLWRVTQKHFAGKDEHAGTQLVGVFVSQPARVWTARKALKSIPDWDGMKLAGGAAVYLEIARALGGVGVRAPGPQAAEMLKRGVVDGVLIDASSYTDFGLAGTVKHMLDFPKGMSAATFAVILNSAKWNSVSAADRAAIEKISGETLSRTAGRNWDRVAAKSRENVKAAGVEVTMAEGAYLKALEGKLRFLEDQWLQKAAAAGVDGRAALSELKGTVNSYRP